jgi:hypothetical protein
VMATRLTGLGRGLGPPGSAESAGSLFRRSAWVLLVSMASRMEGTAVDPSLDLWELTGHSGQRSLGRLPGVPTCWLPDRSVSHLEKFLTGRVFAFSH